MAKFKINAKSPAHKREIEAHSFGLAGHEDEWTDFHDIHGTVVARVRSASINTIDRED